jgi:hypothetical protein
MSAPEIVEYAVLTYKDGRTVRYGRPKGRKRFLVEVDGWFNHHSRLSFSRRSLVERPKNSPWCTGVTFEMASRTMILALALIFGLPSLLCIFWGVVKDNARRQREKRAAEVRAELAAIESARIDSLRVFGARRGPDLPSVRRTAL